MARQNTGRTSIPRAKAPTRNADSSLVPRIEGLSGLPIPLDELLDEIPLGLAILDMDRRILSFNRTLEVMTGFNRGAVVGLPCRQILRTNLCNRDCPILQFQKGIKPISVDGDLIDSQRRKIGIRITTSPLSDNQGHVCGFIEAVEKIRQPDHDPAKIASSSFFSRMLGQSPQMAEVFNILPAVAQTDSSVLITGETGTGKDLVAEVIHEASTRSRGPFIKINCGALPETLLESELFGHAKGAFTGAVSDKPGRLKMAHGGTLFLTEIGDLPFTLQVKLLTFLDDQIVYPIGATKGFQADVRVIAATHRQLGRMVRQGLFRQDLLFRLNVIRVHLPPLRERVGDVKLLKEHYLRKFSERFHKKVRGFSEDAAKLLNQYQYPGNVREIRNIVEYAVGIVRGDVINVEDLPVYLTDTSLEKPFVGTPPEKVADTVPKTAEAKDSVGDALSWPDMERTMILEALVKSKGRRSRAAEILGWGRSTLWRKMKQHGLDS